MVGNCSAARKSVLVPLRVGGVDAGGVDADLGPGLLGIGLDVDRAGEGREAPGHLGDHEVPDMKTD